VDYADLIPQTQRMFEDGEVSILVNVGRGGMRDSYRLVIDQGEYLSRKATLDRIDSGAVQLNRRSMSTVRDLSGEAPENNQYSFMTFYTDILGEVILSTDDLASVTGRYRISTDDLEDGVQKYIRTYKTKNGFSFFFESTDSLNLVEVANGFESRFSASVDRSSFLPGNLFSQILFATEINENGWKPAIYVDSSPLTSERVFFWSLEGGKLTAPIKRSLEIPEGCRPILPMSYGEPRRSAMFFECRGEATTINIIDL